MSCHRRGRSGATVRGWRGIGTADQTGVDRTPEDARHWPTRLTSARQRIRHGIRHTAARAGWRPRRCVANGRLRHMRIGGARVSKADGSQSLDLQRVRHQKNRASPPTTWPTTRRHRRSRDGHPASSTRAWAPCSKASEWPTSPRATRLRGTPIVVTDRRGDAWTTTLTAVVSRSDTERGQPIRKSVSTEAGRVFLPAITAR